MVHHGLELNFKQVHSTCNETLMNIVMVGRKKKKKKYPKQSKFHFSMFFIVPQIHKYIFLHPKCEL